MSMNQCVQFIKIHKYILPAIVLFFIMPTKTCLALITFSVDCGCIHSVDVNVTSTVIHYSCTMIRGSYLLTRIWLFVAVVVARGLQVKGTKISGTFHSLCSYGVADNEMFARWHHIERAISRESPREATVLIRNFE